MSGRVLVRPVADRDLDDQAHYLAAQGALEAGIDFYRAAAETFRVLASHPRMGKLTQYRSSLLTGVRVFPLRRFPQHLVFYRPIQNGIEVIRVLHGARDIERLFED